ncbi:MAG TPA: heavy metal-binding domain-containing protein [Acidimicrobiales bacterium]|nr:heavy metal-binding domain-containing protein [Acidimicrobiales bacterium]
MREWDGRGLPPAAAARLERANRSGVATSLLSVPSHLGVAVAGFSPVGEVMGCIVVHLGWSGYGGCGWYYGMAPPQYTVTSSNARGAFGFAPYVDAKRGAWASALGRMLLECRTLGGDGVVGVRLEERRLEDGSREMMALGTAVRAAGSLHLDKPFATTLAGQDLLKLMQGGYFPAAVIVGISVGVRHDDWMTRQSTYLSAPNMEVPGYTDLVETVRRDVRGDLRRRLGELGATGAILPTPMRLEIGEMEPGEGHRDHIAEATLVATALVATNPYPEHAPLSMLPLR